MAEGNGNQPVTRNELKEELRALEQRLEERLIQTFSHLMGFSPFSAIN